MTRNETRPWWLRLLLRARPQAGLLMVLLLLAVTEIGLNLLKPLPLKIIVDYILPGKALPPSLAWMASLPGGATAPGLLLWLSISTLALFLMGWLNIVIASYLRIEVSGRLTYGLAAEVFRHLQHLSLRFHNRWPAGDLIKRVTVDCGCIRGLVVDVCLPAISAVLTLLTVLALVWRMDASLALLSLAVIPVLAILIKVSAQPLLDQELDYAAAQGDVMGYAEQILTGLPVIQAFGREELATRRFDEYNQRVGSTYVRTVAAGTWFSARTGGVLACGTAVAMAIGGGHVLGGQILLGDLLVYLTYLSYLYAPLQTIAYLTMNYAGAAAGARRVFELMGSEERVREAPDAVDVPSRPLPHNTEIRLEDICFSYEPGRQVLRGVDIVAKPGQSVALVGSTGAGKTTVVSMILRLFDPDSGRVTLDGADIRSYKLESLREQIAIVLQEPFLLPMTVAENIAYARPNAPRDAIIAAARAAHADEFIEKLQDGYDTVIGERGATLSGGPLSHEYQLAQYHCHWGENNSVGAEHLVNGKSYAAEVISKERNVSIVRTHNVISHCRFISSTGIQSMEASTRP
mgnify:CR=1 FL=1